MEGRTNLKIFFKKGILIKSMENGNMTRLMWR